MAIISRIESQGIVQLNSATDSLYSQYLWLALPKAILLDAHPEEFFANRLSMRMIYNDSILAN